MASRRHLPIDDEIAVLREKLAALRKLRPELLIAQDRAIVKAFNDGGTRAQIADAFGVSRTTIDQVLHKAGITMKTRAAIGMSRKARAEYDRLIRGKVPYRTARQIALSVSA